MDGRSGDRGCLRLYRSYVRAGCGGLSGRRSARGPQWRLSGPRRTKNREVTPGCFVRQSLQEKPRLKATTRSLSPSRRHHFDLERHVGTRYEQPDLRSALGYRDRGVLPRAVRQDPRQPRRGQQAVAGGLQACRCVPSRVRLRRVPGHG